jgi:hypothetical protein
MSSRVARGLPGAAAARRDRLSRERTAAQLRRQARLEAEVVEQLGATLGPAGRPMGEAAMTLWRRRRADAYLELPPWRRARLTWVSWGHVHRAVIVLGLAALWTVICLPLRMLGLASLEASQIGVAAIAAAAPLAAFVPPRSRGRFVDLPETRGAPWRGSRAARSGARMLLAAAVAVLALVALLAVLGPGPAPAPDARVTPAARHADVVAARAAVATACGAPVAGRVTPAGDDLYAVAIDGGGTARVAISREVGFSTPGPRAEVVGPVRCPAP